jgi:acyl carrier protein
MSSVIGPRGVADYSAANSFLDAFANYSNSATKFHTLTINWPSWKEVGMLAKLESWDGAEAIKEEEIKKAILTKDGLEAFRRALNSDLQRIIVSPENLDDLVEQSRWRFGSSSYPPLGAADSASAISVSSGPIDEADRPTNDTETTMTGIWRDVFGHQQIGIHQHFSALGGHSLIAMQIVARVRSIFQIDFSLREFFAAPTIAQSSSEIRAKIMREIETLSDDEARRLVRTTNPNRNA